MLARGAVMEAPLEADAERVPGLGLAERPGQDPLGPAEGLLTGLITGSVLWLALGSFVFALIRMTRPY